MFYSGTRKPETPQSLRPSSLLKSGQKLSLLPTVLLATTNVEIHRSMNELFQMCGANVFWATGMKEVRSVLGKEDVAACFCGFWLVDGTYRDIVRDLRRQHSEIPVIIVCEPGCPHEYRDYLGALNIRAFDYICHPYRQADLEKILHRTMAVRNVQAAMQTSSASSPGDDFGPSDLRSTK